MRFDDSDLISGWRYSATLLLRTSLAYLKMEGSFSPGSKEPLGLPWFSRLSLVDRLSCSTWQWNGKQIELGIRPAI